MPKKREKEKFISLAKQEEIFCFAEFEKIELQQALNHYGYNFDDLVYKNSNAKKPSDSKPLTINDYYEKNHSIPLVSFFTGCGGIDLGFEAAGFNHVAAFEFNELFCKTLRKNRPAWKVFGPPTHSGDISNVSEVIESLEKIIPVNFEGVFAGGPPCQPFSIASNQRFARSGQNFKRVGFEHEKNGNLLFDYIEIIKHFRPVCFLIENVAGLRDLDGGKQLSEAIRSLEVAGYKVENPFVLNAANYGVPQFRERIFVIGNRISSNFKIPKPQFKQIGSGVVLKRNQNNTHNTETRVHKLSSVQRYYNLDYGQRDQLGRVDRLDPCLPSKTVIAGGTNGGGRSHLHPEIPRTLSVRECAKLQTFPDDYVFVGPTARQFTQVGNAVPPLLAVQMALEIAQSIFHTEKKEVA